MLRAVQLHIASHDFFLPLYCQELEGPVKRPGCDSQNLSVPLLASRASLSLSSTLYPLLLRLDLLNIRKRNLGRCWPAKDRHHHLERLLIFIDVINRAIEVVERPIGNPNLLTLRKLELELRLLLGHVTAIQHRIN